jgi:hypothetical protein
MRGPREGVSRIVFTTVLVAVSMIATFSGGRFVLLKKT